MMGNGGRTAGDMFIIKTRVDVGELVAGRTKLIWWRGGEDEIGIRERQNGRKQKRAMLWEAQKARSKRMAPGRPCRPPRHQKFLADDDRRIEKTSSPLEKTVRRPTARLPVGIPLHLKKGMTSSLESVDGGDQRIPFVYFWKCLRAWLTETVSLRGR